jgi:hypothetical protein
MRRRGPEALSPWAPWRPRCGGKANAPEMATVHPSPATIYPSASRSPGRYLPSTSPAAGDDDWACCATGPFAHCGRSCSVLDRPRARFWGWASCSWGSREVGTGGARCWGSSRGCALGPGAATVSDRGRLRRSSACRAVHDSGGGATSCGPADTDDEPKDRRYQAETLAPAGALGFVCDDPGVYRLLFDSGPDLTLALDFVHTDGDLDLALYDARGVLVQTSDGAVTGSAVGRPSITTHPTGSSRGSLPAAASRPHLQMATKRSKAMGCTSPTSRTLRLRP